MFLAARSFINSGTTTNSGRVLASNEVVVESRWDMLDIVLVRNKRKQHILHSLKCGNKLPF